MTTRQEQIQKLEKGLATGLIPDNLKPAMEKKLADLKAAEAAESGTAAPAGEEPTKEEKPKKERKPRAKKEGAATAKRGRKPKAQKPAKRTRKPKAEKPAEEAPEETTTGGGDGKPQEVVDCEKIIADWNKGRAKAKMARIKSVAKPVFEKISDKVELAVEQAIKSIPAKEVKENPSGYISKFERLKEAASKFLAEFRSVLGGEYEGDERNEAIKEIETLIAKLKDRFMVEKKEEGGEVSNSIHLRVGSILQCVGWPRLKGLDDGNFYSIIEMDDYSATLVRSDRNGKPKSVKKVRHYLSSIEGAIKCASRGDNNGLAVIKYAEGGSVSGPDDYTDQMMISGTNEINHERQVGDFKAKGGGVNTKYIYRLMNHDNVGNGTKADFERFTLAELNNRFSTNYKTVDEAVDDDPEYLFTADDVADWKKQEDEEFEHGGKVKGGRKYFGMGNFF